MERRYRIVDAGDRKKFFYGLYKDQLKNSGAKHVLHFDLYEGNRLVYALFFATKNEVGCDKMKQAMWKVAPFSGFRFTGGMESQLPLGPEIVDFSPLKDDLIGKFELNNWVSIESVEQFTRSDSTLFHSGQLKRVLRSMEQDGAIEVDDGSRNKKRTFPRGTRFMFISPSL